MRIVAVGFQLLMLFITICSCLDGTGETLEFNTVKAEIRSQFPSVAQLSTRELVDLLANEEAPAPLLLDVRAPEEYAVSHLPAAILVASEAEAVQHLQEVGQERQVVVYCSVGYRSSQLAEKLGELGFGNVYNLEGSIFQWANEGRPVYRGSERVEVVHPYDSNWGQLLDRHLWSYEP